MMFSKIAAALVAATLAVPALAQETADGWQTTCAEADCTLVLRVADPASDRAMATLLATVGPDEDEPIRFGVALPLGLSLEPGIRVVAGEESVALPFEVCFPDGCRASRPLTAPEEAALLRPGPLDLRFYPFGSDRLVSVAVPATGFADAVAAARATFAAD